MNDPIHAISQVTAGFLLVVLVFIGAYDLFVGFKFGRGETVSYQMLLLSQRWPVIPLLAGIVLGHIFWPQLPPSVSGFAGHLHQRESDRLDEPPTAHRRASDADEGKKPPLDWGF